MLNKPSDALQLAIEDSFSQNFVDGTIDETSREPNQNTIKNRPIEEVPTPAIAHSFVRSERKFSVCRIFST
jgi:hypothetical protein